MAQQQEIQLEEDNGRIIGDLMLPDKAQALILFAHGSGSSRKSPRNQYVARELNKGLLGTLLIDLLTPEEERFDLSTARLRFDIPFLSRRLMHATKWLRSNSATRQFPIGLFGASTGSAAALIVAAEMPDEISAVVSRGGRPDLAASQLPRVKAPTLLIVGGHDEPVIEMNRSAMKLMHCTNVLEIVPGATHLFEEPGALEQVAFSAKRWFNQWLLPPNLLPHSELQADAAVQRPYES